MEHILLDTLCYLGYLKSEWHAASVKKILEAVCAGWVLLHYTPLARAEIARKFPQTLREFDGLLRMLETSGSFENVRLTGDIFALTKKLQKRTT